MGSGLKIKHAACAHILITTAPNSKRKGAAKPEIRAMKRQNQDILPLPEEEALNNT
jgi:hypothetical protein